MLRVVKKFKKTYSRMAKTMRNSNSLKLRVLKRQLILKLIGPRADALGQ